MDSYYWGTAWVLLTILVGSQGQTEEDEKRPYKFAFAIEGYQHRSEEKDERGIIMGEFGFVTGDGVYHVTVYATDENGNFKILKMKNYYIGLPGEGTTAAPSRAPAPVTRPVTASTPSTTKSPILQHLEGLMGCSGCIVPDKKKGQSTDAAPPPGSDDGEGLIDERFGSPREPASPGRPAGRPGTSAGRPGTSAGRPGSPSYGQPSGNGKQPGLTAGFTKGPGGTGPVSGVSGGQRPPTGNGAPQYNRPSGGAPGYSPGQSRPQTPGSGGSDQTTPEKNRFGGSPPTSGVTGNPQKQGIGGGGLLQNPGSAYRPGAGGSQESEGLPPGMSMEDLMALLYKFNYTLKYHGHHESGYRNGNKDGAYFFNGGDGLGRNVKYLANEFGFQPNITLVDLGLESPDTPKGENDENELKGYEFKWFYNR